MGEALRGGDVRTEGLFSYVSCERRVPPDHPLRRILPIVDAALRDLSPVMPAAVPMLADLLNHTVSPPLTHMTLPGILRTMFAPRPVPDRFRDTFPKSLIPRPKQLRAMSQESPIMVPAAAALQRHYGGFSCPSIVITGDADRVVDPEGQSIRLAHELNDAALRIVPGAGHMVHHAVPQELAEAIHRVASGRAA